MMDVSISCDSSRADGYRLVVFRDVGAAPALVGSGVIRPLALLLRLETGRLIEIDLGLKDEGIEMSDGDRSRLPSSSSAVIVTDRGLEELDELLEGWDHAVHALGNQNRNDRE